MVPCIPAAYGLKGQPGPTGRGMHTGERSAQSTRCIAWHPVQDAFVLLPTGTTDRGTPKYDEVGKVQDVLAPSMAQQRGNGKGQGTAGETHKALFCQVELAGPRLAIWPSLRSIEWRVLAHPPQVYPIVLTLSMPVCPDDRACEFSAHKLATEVAPEWPAATKSAFADCRSERRRAADGAPERQFTSPSPNDIHRRHQRPYRRTSNVRYNARSPRARPTRSPPSGRMSPRRAPRSSEDT